MVDMSPRAVTARLRSVAVQLAERGFVAKTVDMSPGAVTDRLRIMATLSDMCIRLGKARIKG